MVLKVHILLSFPNIGEWHVDEGVVVLTYYCFTRIIKRGPLVEYIIRRIKCRKDKKNAIFMVPHLIPRSLLTCFKHAVWINVQLYFKATLEMCLLFRCFCSKNRGICKHQHKTVTLKKYVYFAEYHWSITAYTELLYWLVVCAYAYVHLLDSGFLVKPIKLPSKLITRILIPKAHDFTFWLGLQTDSSVGYSNVRIEVQYNYSTLY